MEPDGRDHVGRVEADSHLWQCQARKSREKERKKQADKFWEERDEEDIGEALMDGLRGSKPEPQAAGEGPPSQAAAGRVIGKLSSKNLDVLQNTTASPEVPFHRTPQVSREIERVSHRCRPHIHSHIDERPKSCKHVVR